MYGGYGILGNQCLGTYPILNIHYDAPNRICYYNNDLSQQCCSTTDMMNRLKMQQTMNCLQAQTQSLKDFENQNKIIDSIKPLDTSSEIKIKEEKEETKKSIKDYMNKEFFYESELKEIEDKFHFRLNIFKTFNKNNKFYNVVNKIIEKIELEDNDDYISIINTYRSLKEISIYTRKKLLGICIEDCVIEEEYKEEIINICNTILKQNITEYRQFYEKYKNRIVKDNEYEDLSYYEKILKENC